MSATTLFILTGEKQTGKTTFCIKILGSAKTAGLDVAGIISPPVFENGLKAGIDAMDPRTNERRHLAIPVQTDRNITTTGLKWEFDPGVLEWGNQVIGRSTPCDLLLIDELGPLEFLHNQGWQAGFDAIGSRKYRLAIVVIRPSLVDAAKSRWPDSILLPVPDPDKAQEWIDRFVN